MISFDFAYYRPTQLEEAVRLFGELKRRGHSPLYMAGGTEIVTLARISQLYTEAVIDIKAIPECVQLEETGSLIRIGSAVTLNRAADSGIFPLLGSLCDATADRTSRNQITVGGNLAGRIIYREAVLAFLVADSRLVAAGPSGMREIPIAEGFREVLRLQPGELLVRIETDAEYAALPYFHAKKRQLDVIDYPIVTLAALQRDGKVRMAFSGVCGFPFRSAEMEAELNRPALTAEERVDRALSRLPAPVLHDIRASADYRRHVLRTTMLDALEALEGTR
jgi:xanthine dehydrogenase molybdenum-binding subunit